MGESMGPKTVDLDGILENAGRIGRYQMILQVLICFPLIIGSMYSNNYIFAAPDTEYRCKITECENSNTIFGLAWINNSIIANDKCSRFKYVGNNSDLEQNSTCPANNFDRTKLIPCEGYVFKFNNTFIEEMDIPCEFWKRTLLGTLASVGTLLALPLVGFVSDKFGRKTALILSGVSEGICGIVKSFSINYGMYAAAELIGPTLGSGLHSSSYIIALESMVPSTRVAGGILMGIYIAIGQALLGTVAWLIPYWRTFLRAIYGPAFLLILFYWLIEESNRWLLSKQRYEEAAKNVMKIARTNKTELPDEIMADLNYNINNKEDFVNFKEVKCGKNIVVPENEKRTLLKQLLSSKTILYRIVKCSVWWVTCTFCFYGMSINAVALAGNIYTNYILNATVEIPAHIFGYFSLRYFGRKKTVFVSFLIPGVCLLAFTFIPTGMDSLSLTAFLVGKMFIGLVFTCTYLYTSELFPTPLRHSLLAFCSMVGRIGAIAAPQTPLLALYLKELPLYLFASTCLVSAILTLTMPETVHSPLPETIEEAENIGTIRSTVTKNHISIQSTALP